MTKKKTVGKARKAPHKRVGSDRHAGRASAGRTSAGGPAKRIRYAVIGQGYISQVAVLPAFKHARRNSELAALVSDDAAKLRKLGKLYGVKRLASYDQYDELLGSGEIDAVYIALPNDMHRDFAVRAAAAGVHVLCEKPMEVGSSACLDMIGECERMRVKLMIAYRLHFEKSNLTAIETVRKGVIGDPRVFNSTFSIAPKGGGIRMQPRSRGGGPMFDIGIYCLNTARSLFRDEPTEVSAMELRGDHRRFKDVEETLSVSLRFPGDRVANFVCSFGCAPAASYEVLGTKGSLAMKNPYEYAGKREMILTVKGKESRRVFTQSDQFAPELLYFSDCILKNRVPEPSGLEGLADVMIIESIFESASSGRAVKIPPLPRKRHPDAGLRIDEPAIRKPRLVKVDDPAKEVA